MSATRLRHQVTLDNMRLNFETRQHLLVSIIACLIDMSQEAYLPSPASQAQSGRRRLNVGRRRDVDAFGRLSGIQRFAAFFTRYALRGPCSIR